MSSPGVGQFLGVKSGGIHDARRVRWSETALRQEMPCLRIVVDGDERRLLKGLRNESQAHSVVLSLFAVFIGLLVAAGSAPASGSGAPATYVANYSASSVTEYAAGVSGDVAPSPRSEAQKPSSTIRAV